MPTRTLEDKPGTGTLSAADGRKATVDYHITRTQFVENKPGFGPFEDTPELRVSFPRGTGGITGRAILNLDDGRSVQIEIGGFGAVVVTGSLE
jgi:hypothetical protein